MPTALAVDTSQVYWVTNVTGGTVQAISIVGGTYVLIAEALDHPSALAIDSLYAYWVTADGGVFRKAKAGGNVKHIAAGYSLDGTRVLEQDDNGAFIGEIAYLTGKPATATVVVDKPSRVLTFSRARLNKVIEEDPQISGIIYELLGRDLARKMGQVNSQRTASDLQTARI